MRKPKVFCTETDHIISKEVQAFLREHVELFRPERKLHNNELVEQIGDAEGLISMGYRINKELLEAAPKLRVVSTASVGYDPFDLPEMKKHGVIGLHTPDVLNSTVADLIVALMFGVGRRMCELDALVRQGKWKGTPFHLLFGCELSNKKLGIIGMGGIGETLARKVIGGFDMQVSYYNRNRKWEAEAKYGVQYKPMDALLQESDYVVVMVPQNDQTYHMIGKREFALMNKNTIFINASRGPVVDESALIEALQNGEIYGAGLDVFEKEPIGADNPLTKLPNTVLMPHVASGTVECRAAMGWMAARGLVDFLEGRTPTNIIPFFRDQ